MSKRNTIFVIKPYRWNGVWVFDEPDVGLVREPFVAGVPQMIEHATRDIPDAERGFLAVFSAGYFPDATITLERVRPEGGGHVYRWPQTGQEGWLCPALFKYFDQAPERLYCPGAAGRGRRFRSGRPGLGPRVPGDGASCRMSGINPPRREPGRVPATGVRQPLRPSGKPGGGFFRNRFCQLSSATDRTSPRSITTTLQHDPARISQGTFIK